MCPAFVAASVHKWLLGPYGTSLLYVAPQYRATQVALERHERALLGSDIPVWDERGAMTATGAVPLHSLQFLTDSFLILLPIVVFFHCLTTFLGYPTTLVASAARLDSGGRPNPILLPMLNAALKLVLSWTPARVEAYCRPISQRIADYAQALGLVVPAVCAAHIIGIYLPPDLATHLEAIRDGLNDAGFSISLRNRAFRVSVHVYNTMDEAENFCRALHEQILMFRRKGVPA